MQLHRLIDELREQAPIVPVQFMGMPSWLITRHAELEQAFRDTENLPPERAYKFGIEPLIGETFQTMSGDRHRFYRKLATPTFRPRMVEQLNFTMFADVANELWAYLDPVIADRQTNPRDDVISQLIHDEVDGVRMTPEEVKSNVAIMFTAGSSTTHDSIGNLVFGLTTTEDYWEQVRDNSELRENAIEEALRWEPAVSFLPRISKMEGVAPFAGVDIQPNTFVIMGIAAANHDPAMYDDPHRFDIFRQPKQLICRF